MSKEPTTEVVQGWIDGAVDVLYRTVLARAVRAWDVFVYSSLYITSIAVVEGWLATELLGLEPNAALAIIGLITFSVYMNDRIADADTDRVSNPAQVAFVRRHQGGLFALAAGAYGLAVMLGVLGGPAALVLTLLPGVFWVCYALDYFSAVTDGVSRLKDIVVVNTVVVAVAWAMTVTFLPIALASQPVSAEVWAVFAFFLSRDFVHTEVPNVPDRFSDARIGVDTLPSRYGLVTTRRALYVLNLATLAFVATVMSDLFASRATTVALVGGLCYSLLAVGLIGRWSREDRLGTLSELEYPLLFLILVI